MLVMKHVHYVTAVLVLAIYRPRKKIEQTTDNFQHNAYSSSMLIAGYDVSKRKTLDTLCCVILNKAQAQTNK
jgi:hypothetical protein